VHRLLQGQLKRVVNLRSPEDVDVLLSGLESLSGLSDLPPAVTRFLSGARQLLERVSLTYEQFDRDLDLRARSLELSSQELLDANERLRRDAEAQARAIESLRESANRLLAGNDRADLDDGTDSLEKLSRLMAALVRERTTA